MKKNVKIVIKDNGGYSIFKDGINIINTETNPISTYHEVVDTMFKGYEINIVDADNIANDIENTKKEFETKTFNDDVVGVGIDPWENSNTTGAYKDTFENSDIMNMSDSEVEIDEPEVQSENNTNKGPIGYKYKPAMGDIIYIDGVTSTLSKITGGLATVLSVKVTDDDIVTDQIETESLEFEDEMEYEDVTEKNILVELEEFPGTFISWTMIREKQDELQDKYGYTTAKKISLFS